MEREARLSRAFVDLADTLVHDYDVTDFLHLLCERCSEVLGVDAAGVLLTDGNGDLRLSAASTEKMRILELFELQHRQGPCYDAYRSGAQLLEREIEGAEDRWPTLVPRALAMGFKSVYAFPLRVRNERVGALNLFRYDSGPLDDRDVDAAQALADVATIGILQERAVTDARVRTEQLQHALNSRVVIEQAKGVLATRMRIEMEEAFGIMRRYARNHSVTVRSVCQDVIDGKIRFD
jgi:GAF domain-containing protein